MIEFDPCRADALLLDLRQRVAAAAARQSETRQTRDARQIRDTRRALNQKAQGWVTRRLVAVRRLQLVVVGSR